MKFKIGLVEYTTEDHPRSSFNPGEKFIQTDGGNHNPIVRKQISQEEMRKLEYKHGSLTNAMFNIFRHSKYYIFSRSETPNRCYLIID